MNIRKMVRMNERGFTLVELMIVVAIIGILASVAIPNFQKYQAKARQSEAKIALSSAYTALAAHQAEHQSYTACLANIGVGVDANQKRYYTVGTLGGDGCGPVGSQPCLGYQWNTAGTAALASCTAGPNVNFFPSNARVRANYTTPTTAPDGTAGMTYQAFTVGAVGSVSNNTLDDRWSIDQTKSLINVSAGL